MTGAKALTIWQKDAMIIITMIAKENYNSITVYPTQKLSGSVRVPGDKVAAVHLSFASILSSQTTTIQNTHDCADVLRIQNWIEASGIASVSRKGATTTLTPQKLKQWETFDLTEFSDTRVGLH